MSVPKPPELTQAEVGKDTTILHNPISYVAPDYKPDYIVGIGASAGGLEALESLFASMPLKTGMAYVVIQHLSPDYKSMMAELLARKTMIPIRVVEDQMPIYADTVYLLPPNKEMIAANGRLLLTEREDINSVNLPINTFLRSLAETHQEKSIAIILSGTGSDGSKSVQLVHDYGGLVIAQTPESCKFSSMPESAIKSGSVDLTINTDQMPSSLIKYITRTVNLEERLSIEETDPEISEFAEILVLLRNRFNLDFSEYKPSTITRRLERRLSYQKTDVLRDYLEVLISDEAELERLYYDLLIGVTQFFRDSVAFESLNSQLPQLLEKFADEPEIRIWVAACATGQEAYTMAMVISNAMENSPQGIKPFKIFATDVHANSIRFAATGIYEEVDLRGVDESNKARYFQQLGSGQYQVIPELRKRIVFAQHNLLKDPPFTRTHLVNCRNLLIYFNSSAQQRALSLLTFSLKNQGLLFLGPSETLSSHASDFLTVDSNYRIFRKTRDSERVANMPLSIRARNSAPAPFQPTIDPASSLISSKSRKAQEILLQQYVPASVLVDDEGNILHTFGDAGDYLSINFGVSSLNIRSLVTGQAKSVLVQMLSHIAKNHAPVKTRKVSGFNKFNEVDVEIRVLSESPNDLSYYLISFCETPVPKVALPPITSDSTDSQELINESLSTESSSRIKELEEELQYSQENLQTTIEELGTSNEELQSSNEELMAANEELQSTNEELQSVNEELFTVNDEFQRKQIESDQLASDERSILEESNVGILFFDKALCVRKFSPAAGDLFNLIEGDQGRPLSAVSGAMDSVLCNDIRAVFDSGGLVEKELIDDSRTYLVRINAYIPAHAPTEESEHTLRENNYAVVLTFTNISQYRELQTATEKMQLRYSEILNAMSDGYFEWIIDSDESFFPQSFVQKLGYLNERPGFDQLLGENSSVFKEKITQSIEDGQGVEEVLPFLTKKGEQLWMFCKGSVLDANENQSGKFTGILLDFTTQKQIQKQQSQQAVDLQRSNELLVQFANIVSHDMRAPLRHIKNYLAFLEEAIDNNDMAAVQEELKVIHANTNSLDALIDDIIMYSRVNSEKKAITSVSMNGIIDLVIHTLSPMIEENDIQIQRTKIPPLHGDKSLLTHLFQNLISNACKYTDKEKPQIDISHEVTKTHCLISVRDNGIGFDMAYAVQMFEPFQRLVTKSEYEGTGIGLSICKTVVEQHNGTIDVTSTEGAGSCFTVSLPLNEGVT